MDYHNDFYNDYSFVLTKKGVIVAVLPGHKNQNTYFSHMGITYGGIISGFDTRMEDIEFFMYSVIEILRAENVVKLVYKPVPYIYHNYPSQEDIFVLYKLGAIKSYSAVSTVVEQSLFIKISTLRKRGYRRAVKNEIRIEESYDFKIFWQILEESKMGKYCSKPVHTLEQISFLRDRFPDNIKLYIALYENKVVAGIVLYLASNVVKFQYIASNTFGKKKGALDYLIYQIVFEMFPEKKYFDPGTSHNKENGNLNYNLLFQKEGFGGRTITYDTYSVSI